MIRGLSIPEEIASRIGLHGLLFRDLGRYVVLAGPNGSGKTRCLELVSEAANAAAEAQEFSKENLDSMLSNGEIAVSNILEQNKTNRFIHKALVEKCKTARAELTQLRRIASMRDLVEFSTVELDQKKRLRMLSLELLHPRKIPHPNSLARDEFDQVVDDNREGGFLTSYKSIHAYLEYIAQSLYALDHPQEKSPTEMRRLHDASMFNKISNCLLQAEVSYRLGSRSRPEPIFKNRPFSAKELSSGERVLLSWAILLHRQQTWLHDSILFIDEPDLYLHPDVAVQTLRRLDREIIGEHGQIWLATHNIAILAEIGLDSIYFVSNGTIRFAGRSHIQMVTDSLLGGKEGRSKLGDFLSSADQIAFSRFALECTLPPKVASHKSNDKQEIQFIDIMNRLTSERGALRLLDFASGRGRLLVALNDLAESHEHLKHDCYAFNEVGLVSASDRSACNQALQALYGPNADSNRYIESRADLRAHYKGFFDLIVMSNVLHEIDVTLWCRLFQDIFEILGADGYLVIIEDLRPPIGELPNLRGYLLLEPSSLQILFGDRDAVQVIDSREDGRLVGVRIPKQFLPRVSTERIHNALSHARDRALEEIRLIRQLPSEKRDARSGHRHALYSMQYTNLQLALELVSQ